MEVYNTTQLIIFAKKNVFQDEQNDNDLANVGSHEWLHKLKSENESLNFPLQVYLIQNATIYTKKWNRLVYEDIVVDNLCDFVRDYNTPKSLKLKEPASLESNTVC